MKDPDKFIESFIQWTVALTGCFCVLAMAAWFVLEVVSSLLGIWAY